MDNIITETISRHIGMHSMTFRLETIQINFTFNSYSQYFLFLFIKIGPLSALTFSVFEFEWFDSSTLNTSEECWLFFTNSRFCYWEIRSLAFLK